MPQVREHAQLEARRTAAATVPDFKNDDNCKARVAATLRAYIFCACFSRLQRCLWPFTRNPRDNCKARAACAACPLVNRSRYILQECIVLQGFAYRCVRVSEQRLQGAPPALPPLLRFASLCTAACRCGSDCTALYECVRCICCMNELFP